MKEIILVTSFGSTVDSAREKQIFPVVEDIRKANPEHEVRVAFTSRIVIKRLKDRNIVFQNEIEAMESIVAEGYERIIVQPTHLVGGAEFDKLRKNIMAFNGQGSVQDIVFGRPLLYFMGQEEEVPDDYQTLIDRFIKALQVPTTEDLLLVGHGGFNVGNASYAVLQLKLQYEGFRNISVATLENFPTPEDILARWEREGHERKKVHLHPLLLVCGDHALNDLFGEEEDSLLSELTTAGYEVVPYEKGLGEYKEIQDIYVDHLADAMQGLYQKRL
ncbi:MULTISPECIES: sirohydrochlorin cobaltochelatase [unclassified Veillonella]|uniref:sirohydrochlorin cobaltochelatase n=1 Tax=unclassified Veillonella TaxID=2630086 RepID=UPI000F8DD5A9|nr:MULTISPECIES: sirohydrochlorin cobaltochelatase [unclassified Veillonella]